MPSSRRDGYAGSVAAPPMKAVALKAASRQKVPGDATLANEAMEKHGLVPQFPQAVLREVKALESAPSSPSVAGARDLRRAPWVSMDPRTAGNVEQVVMAEALEGDRIRLRVAVANVAAAVSPTSALDRHAANNGLSIYTDAKNYPLFPWRLAEKVTSLDEGVERQAMVIEMTIASDGKVESSDVFPALVVNQSQRSYRDVDQSRNTTAVLQEQVELQSEAARRLFEHREAEEVLAPQDHPDGGADDLVEEFMIAANRAACDFLESKGFPVMERVVKNPVNWSRIVGLARKRGAQLPARPEPASLRAFLDSQKTADPEGFADLSLAVLKLLGRGEYVATRPGQRDPVDFRLSSEDTTPTTAPFRRYADLITQRLLLAAASDGPPPYSFEKLQGLAQLCSLKEGDAMKVKRQVEKSLKAKELLPRVGQTFRGVITGASPKGTWVRVHQLRAEGKVVSGSEGLEVGDKVDVRLASVDVRRGFIDFKA